ncbi:hypothetical protein [Mycobacterium sp.]|uniref:hypothetical protein n=1 Tax=Mycobacterium sp. TaxID=1785 RepID=UPI003F7DDE15
MRINRTITVRRVVWAAGLLLLGRVHGRRRVLLLRVGLMCRCRFLLLLRRVGLMHWRCRFFLFLLHRLLMHGRRRRLLNRSGCGLVHRRWRLYRWRGLHRRLNGLLLPRGQTAPERPTAAAERATAKAAAA